MRDLIARIGAVLVLSAAGTSLVSAQLTWSDILFFEAPEDSPFYSNELLAKTKADECFDGIGVDYPPINPDGTCDVGTPKKNQGYVWGLTEAGVGDPSFSGDKVWFGTFANPFCVAGTRVQETEPYINASWVCEFGESQPARQPGYPLPPFLGDWRLPRAYSYDLGSRVLTDRTPSDPRYLLLIGLRSAGSVGNAVIMAGPSFRQDVVFAAWNAATGTYTGSCRATNFIDIRSWITVNGTLYAGVATRDGAGAIVRWAGTVDQPFDGDPGVSETCGFETVAALPGFPAYLASYNDERLAASLWVNRKAQHASLGPRVQASSAGVYVSPPLAPVGSLSGAKAAADWVRIWSPSDYEPDPVMAQMTDGGAIAYWKGYLWFGSINNDGLTVGAHSGCGLRICYGPPANAEEAIDLLFNVHRGASIWRARLLPDDTFEVELLYGETELPVLVPGTKTFEPRPTGHVPRFGNAGFDNPFNRYTWSAVATDHLLFGFYDSRYSLDIRLGLIPDPRPPIDEARGYGGDLWRFDDPDTPAQPETVRGMGNFTNYGIRNMIAIDGGPDIAVGTANGLNLEPDGGWELLLLTLP
jgi:hypothetical protein